MIAETNQSGQMLAEYVYLEDQLLATVKPGESTYYFHNDHLGTPQVLTDGNGSVAWKAVYMPFGGTQILVESVENPFRFPGQYYDQETGLNYNYFRYYYPLIAGYITPDPIGLEGGINLFTYARNNSVNFIDPVGLFILSIKYSDKPYGSITVVWNSWLPHFFRSGTRGDNGAEIASGIYSYQYGQHPMNPMEGQTAYPALNLYTLNGSRYLPGTRIDILGNELSDLISGVNFHWGNRVGSPLGTGSRGCHVIPKTNWNNFINQFERGDEGYYAYIRFR